MQQGEKNMKKYYNTLLESTLFHGISESELDGLMKCLSVILKSYEKNQFILMAGTCVNTIGIMVEGSAQITREDADGNRAILSDLGRSDLFAEAYAVAESKELPITVIATSPSTVIWVPFDKIVSRCDKACEFHRILIENLIKIIAKKNILINEKMRLLSCKTTRAKLLTYLVDYSEMTGRNKFKIPFTRNELADFLSVDRSAMSRELSKLRDDGYIRFKKNEFELLKPNP
jgi:CRP-like cAMP-binding protein